MLKLKKMPLEKQTIIVEYQGAKFHFRVLNDLDKFDFMTATKTSERIKATFETLEKVENVVDENDKPIDASEILEKLSLEQITNIMVERNKQFQQYAEQHEAEAKNLQSSIETQKLS